MARSFASVTAVLPVAPRPYATHTRASAFPCADDCVVKRFRSLTNGDIVPTHIDGTKPKGRRNVRRIGPPLQAVEMQPARDETIIAKGAGLRGWHRLGTFATVGSADDPVMSKRPRWPATWQASTA